MNIESEANSECEWGAEEFWSRVKQELKRQGAEEERARIRRELLAEMAVICGLSLNNHGEYGQGRDHERDYFEEQIRAALDRICPEEG